MISAIDRFCVENLNIPAAELMRRSAASVAESVFELTKEGDEVLILAGKGNNGGDGYAAASILSEGRRVVVCDVFSAGQATEEGRFWLEKCPSPIIKGITNEVFDIISRCACIVDAIFGTGMSGDIPATLFPLADAVNSSKAKVVAIDIPLGVRGLDGSVCERVIKADLTVALSYLKPALVSYPAKDYVGELRLCTLSLPSEKIEEYFDFSYRYTDEREALSLVPKRAEKGNKGSFGRVGLIVGSEKYLGAAHLALEAALRGGAGLTYFIGKGEIIPELRSKFPEAIYSSPKNNSELLNSLAPLDSLLIGCGCGTEKELYELVCEIIPEFSGQIIIDADGLNSISRFGSPEILKKAKKQPIITPHPLEFSRLCGKSVDEIEKSRLSFAKSFALEYNCILLLKGAATIVTDGKRVYINGSGSTALAKGGSGDALAGLIASLSASLDPLESAALAAYIHGRAGDNLANELSDFGVTPSDLPREMARVLSQITK